MLTQYIETSLQLPPVDQLVLGWVTEWRYGNAPPITKPKATLVKLTAERKWRPYDTLNSRTNDRCELAVSHWQPLVAPAKALARTPQPCCWEQLQCSTSH